jgi:tetratricopeptide (TPR) repeat protein
MDLVSEAKDYVKELFLNNKNELLLFHNIGYINKAVNYANQICEMEKVGKDDRETILVSAWLFSTGFLFDYIDFKKQSIRIAHEFLKARKVNAEKSEAILMTIETVLHNKQHENICGEILYDASEFYVAIDEFLLWVKYHRQERNYFLKPKLTKRSFWQTVETYLNEHEFCTRSGKALFSEGKGKNLGKIKFLLKQELKQQLPTDNRMIIEDLKEEIRQINQKVEKRLSSTRGFDTLYRITARNQITLSGLADNKASILISLNTLIVSAVITFVFVYSNEFRNMMVPSFITIGFSMLSITLAIIAARPKINPGVFSMDDFHEKKAHLLFYGNFFKVNYGDYEAALKAMLEDQDLLLSNLTRDQYTLGKILGVKFRLLNISFTVFLIGFVLSTLSFAVTIFFFN